MNQRNFGIGIIDRRRQRTMVLKEGNDAEIRLPCLLQFGDDRLRVRAAMAGKGLMAKGTISIFWLGAERNVGVLKSKVLNEISYD